MTYQQTLEYIHSLEKFGSRPGLDSIRTLCAALGNPQNSLKFIHVAGTNGKGSTCHYIANILSELGFKVGLYTSPSVYSILERIQVLSAQRHCEANFSEPWQPPERAEHQRKATQGSYITKQSFTKHADTIIKTGLFATEFEFFTALAFLYFNKEKCDYVVLETGLGGLLDATNIIPPPELAILTPISYDHMDILGSTLEEIAQQKCGIIKNNCLTLTAPQQPEVMKIIERHCEEKHAVLHRSNQATLISTSLNGTHFKIKNSQSEFHNHSSFIIHHSSFFTPLLGLHQIQNAALAITAVQLLLRHCEEQRDEAIQKGLSKTYLPCRFEIVHNCHLSSASCPLIFDGGHNPQGGEILTSCLKTYFPNQKIIFIIGMLKDKDVEGYIKQIAPLAEKIICITPNYPRALPAADLAHIASKYCNNIRIEKNINNAIKKETDDIQIICGSFTLFTSLLPDFY